MARADSRKPRKSDKKGAKEVAAKASTKESKKEVIKAVKRNPRVERILAKKAPLVSENTKSVLFLKGHQSSEVVNGVLADLNMLAKPNSTLFTKKNEILPFENHEGLEFLMDKNDCSLFAFVNSTKKRPNNLTIGRTHDGQMLDMVELGVDKFTSLMQMPGTAKAVGSKPLLVFQGDTWSSDPNFSKLENLLLDFFRGEKIDKLSLRGVDHIISCSAVGDKVFIRGYSARYTKSGTKVPDLALSNMGPFMDLSMRRTKFASEELMKQANKKPRQVTMPNKVKNVSRNDKGEKVGRIHMKKQDLDSMDTRRVTALRNDGAARARQIVK
jgi:ribosome production factor 2